LIELSPLDERGKMILTHEEVLDVQARILRIIVIREYCFRWRDWLIRDATWESEQIL